MLVAIFLHNRNNVIFYLKKKFLYIFIIVLFNMNSGRSAITQNKLVLCVQKPAINLRETMLNFDKCASIEFKHCYQDDVSGSNSDRMSLLQDPCGFIDSQKVSLYRYMWRLTSRQTVWIDILHFNLYFVDFPCTVEYITIEDTGMENLYCGTRVPWKYYSLNSTVNVTFISDVHLPKKGEFQLFFQEGMKVWHSKYINQVTLTDQRHIFHYAKRDETQFLYFIAHRLHIIHLNISSCWSGSHIAIYDGPGIKSPQKRVSSNVTSSAFILLVVVTTKDSNAALPHCQQSLMRYKSTYNETKRCVTTFNSAKVPEEVHVSIKSAFLGTERCTWNVPSNITLLTIDDKGAVERPETLLDDEHCIYGGTYIYSKKNDADLQEVYLKCRKGKHNKPFKFIHNRNTDTVIAAVVFYPYSKITDQDFISFQTWTWPMALENYRTRIDNCTIKKICEASINFPADFIFADDITFYTQYIGHSDVSTGLEFSQQLAPAYTAYFTSSLCNTPPHYCTCIKLQVKHSNPVSYLIPEANRVDHFFVPNKDGYEADIPFASSLYINMSACEARNYKIWWMLTFVKWKFFDAVDFKIKSTNTSFPLVLNDNMMWHILKLDALLNPVYSSVWWFLLHIIENAPISVYNTDIVAKVCIHCLICHNIQLSVEVLQQGKDESIVYNITNHRLIHSTNYKHRPFKDECITGIMCTACNIILTYRGNLPQNQTEGCGCEYSELGVLAKTFGRDRKSTSATSVKGNPISKVSKR